MKGSKTIKVSRVGEGALFGIMEVLDFDTRGSAKSLKQVEQQQEEGKRRQTVVAQSHNCSAFYMEWKEFRKTVQKFITTDRVQEFSEGAKTLMVNRQKACGKYF
jgi:hypothetical protein